MKRFALIAMLLTLGFVAGCESKKPAVPMTPVAPPADDAVAPKDDGAAPDKAAPDKADDMPEDEKDK